MNRFAMDRRLRLLETRASAENVVITLPPETFPDPLPLLEDSILDAWEKARELDPGDTLIAVGIGTFTRLATGEIVSNVRAEV